MASRVTDAQIVRFPTGLSIGKKEVQAFIKTLKIPKEDKDRLLKLTPSTYIGMADKF